MSRIIYTRRFPIDEILVPTKVDWALEREAVRALAAQHREVWRFRKLGVRSLIALVLMFSVAVMLGNVGTTMSYFSDVERSIGNLLQAGSLNFSTEGEGYNGAYVGIEYEGEGTFIPVVTPDPESFPGSFHAYAEITGGDSAFCNALSLSLVSPVSYSGPLASFVSATTTTHGSWELEVSLGSITDVANGDECEVDIVFYGAEEEKGIYNDEERVTLELYARLVVLNEFLPDPEGMLGTIDFGADGDASPLGEWIELYNNGETAADLSGWSVGDAEGSVPITIANTFPAGTTIAPSEWKVVYLNQELLDNTHDTVRLIDPEGHVADYYYYSGTLPNKSFARIPDGVGAWVDPIPTPGYANILADVSVNLFNEEETAPADEIETAKSSSTEETAETASTTPEVPPSTGGGGGGGGNGSGLPDPEPQSEQTEEEPSAETEQPAPEETPTPEDSTEETAPQETPEPEPAEEETVPAAEPEPPAEEQQTQSETSVEETPPVPSREEVPALPAEPEPAPQPPPEPAPEPPSTPAE